MKVALVHDDLIQWGGAERVLLAMQEIWPDAPIFTSAVNQKIVNKHLPQAKIFSSFVQKLPFAQTFERQYFFLQPLAFESFDFSGYDVVISSTSRFAKGVITKPQTMHITYCHTPSRFLWSFETTSPSDYLRRLEGPLSPSLKLLKKWDLISAARPDLWISNSDWVGKRIAKIYQKEAKTIYPFVDLTRFKDVQNERGEYLLVVSRLVKWKKIELAIDAVKSMDIPLKIVGSGPDLGRLKSKAFKKVEFITEASDEEVVHLMANCLALLVCHEEDFGMVAIEVQAAGRPVIAFKNSGTSEAVIDGKTGVIFDSQNVESIRGAVSRLKDLTIDPDACRDQAARFDKEIFKQKLLQFTKMSYNKYQKTNG